MFEIFRAENNSNDNNNMQAGGLRWDSYFDSDCVRYVCVYVWVGDLCVPITFGLMFMSQGY